jgi:hypothetical protein
MITLAQAREGKGYLEVMRGLPQLKDDGESFRMLWHCNYYDGPMSGVALVAGAPHWFDCIGEGSVDPDPDGTPMAARVFGVVPMSAEEYQVSCANHELFESILGLRRYTYEDGRRRRHETHIPYTMEDLKARYYDAKDKPRYPDLKDKEIIGWWAVRYLDFDAMILAGMDPDADEDSDDVD